MKSFYLIDIIPISVLLFKKSYFSKKITLEYKKIQQNELQFLRLTGLSPAEFEALSVDFSVEFEAYMSKYTFEGKE
ncbi:MAG: hypothetical protein EZS26_003549 [Candidatus Ordinivivax streblomastigis]|uniref:Uncharacterized protein n=1 Tax=Candidatus Ordinivivax streblomastigis TaxID=2540710 RepID=A0A5M8NUN0_9BACT|nr:MAG: hypothetical protein EZS26_003549 [Candidatus Ordinivivax streblomastigis]